MPDRRTLDESLISRRQLLRFAALGGTAALLAACAPATPTPQPTAAAHREHLFYKCSVTTKPVQRYWFAPRPARRKSRIEKLTRRDRAIALRLSNAACRT